LAATLRPLAEEIVPLPHQRRPRRFWARWREVAGDRGVRRDFVEALLRDVDTVEALLSELIGEVQGVDPGSVAEHLARHASDGVALEPPPPAPAERPRGPLVGASVQVEGVLSED
jgi:hypothetical protein